MIEVDGIIFSLQRHGGVSVYARQILAGLEAARRSALLSLAEPSHLAPAARPGGSVGVRSRPARRLERYRSFDAAPGASLCHSTYYRVPAGGRVPLVTTVYDFVYERFWKGPALWVHRAQKRHAIRRSEAVICISHSTRADLLRFVPEVDPGRVHVVHLAAGEAFRPEPVPPPERPFVLFVGKREGYKNFRLLLAALDDLPDVEVVCVGGEAPGDPDFEELPQAARGRVRFLRGVDDAALNRLYNQATCLAYTSAYEGFGIPVLEAMRAGCPVVTAGCASVMEIATGACRAVAPDDPRALARAVREVAAPAEREELRQAGIEVASGFSWSRCYRETAAVYDEVLLGARAGQR